LFRCRLFGSLLILGNGYPPIMIIDTAFYRNPNYHTETDTIDTLNFDKMSDLLKGLVTVAKNLAMTSSSR
ncbi:MAG: hypothetical protein ACXWMJ_11065, partial [Syntrophales bacterium]